MTEIGNEVKKVILILKLISIFFVINLAVIFIVAKQGIPQQNYNQDPQNITVIFMWLAAVLFIIGFFIKNIFLKDLNSNSSEIEVKNYLRRYFISHIISCAFLEACAICGMLASMQTGNINYFLSCGSLTIIGIIFNFPNHENLLSKLKIRTTGF